MHPHFPLVAPPEFRALYDPDDVELPATAGDEHPVISLLRHGFRHDEPLTDEQIREATVCYWALISHLDHQIGRLLAAVPDDTVVRSSTSARTRWSSTTSPVRRLWCSDWMLG